MNIETVKVQIQEELVELSINETLKARFLNGGDFGFKITSVAFTDDCGLQSKNV